MSTFDRRSLLIAAMSATGGGAVFAASDRPATANKLPAPGIGSKVRNTRGKILYIGDDDKERGREWFGFSHREDGQVTLRAYCEMDDIQVARDVVQSMTSKFAPLDCFVRLHVGGKFLGSGWIRVTEKEAECEVSNIQLGRVHQRLPLAIPATSLVSHPLSADALLMANFDHGKPERVQYWEGGLSTSPLRDGASGPFLAVGGRRGVEYAGPEKLTTAAGSFDTHHYRLLMGSNAGTPSRTSYDIWCTHPDYIFVRGEVRGYLTNSTGYGRYELVEFAS